MNDKIIYLEGLVNALYDLESSVRIAGYPAIAEDIHASGRSLEDEVDALKQEVIK